VNAELDGRTALVTGGGKGIGRAESTAHEAGGEAVQCDVCDSGAVQALVKGIGGVDVLVNNAGAVRDTLLLRMKEDDWDRIIQTDLSSAFHTTKAVMSGMLRARWGRIVNMTSVVGLTGNPGQANYAAAKAGLVGFTKAIAKEVGSRGITSNAVAPGYVRTELTESSLPEEAVHTMVGMTPLGREGTPEDIAGAVAFLCSPRAAFITGHVLVVDGGLTCI
jgi:3-oxoacyl-[acyl-carrier protein] reductase